MKIEKAITAWFVVIMWFIAFLSFWHYDYIGIWIFMIPIFGELIRPITMNNVDQIVSRKERQDYFNDDMSDA